MGARPSSLALNCTTSRALATFPRKSWLSAIALIPKGYYSDQGSCVSAILDEMMPYAHGTYRLGLDASFQSITAPDSTTTATLVHLTKWR